MRRAAVVVACCFSVALCSVAKGVRQSEPQEGSQILDQPFPEGNGYTEGPLQAMEDFLRPTGLSGGIVILNDDCEEAPNVYWKAIRGTFRPALDDFQADNPAYRWELRGSALNLVPAAGIPPLLAAKIQNFDLRTTDRQTAVGVAIQRLLALPEIRQTATALHLKEGTYYGGGPMAAWDYSSGKTPPPPPPPRPISVQVKDVSLQDALNAVAQAYGHTVWWYSQRGCQGEVTYTVEESRGY